MHRGNDKLHYFDKRQLSARIREGHKHCTHKTGKTLVGNIFRCVSCNEACRLASHPYAPIKGQTMKRLTPFAAALLAGCTSMNASPDPLTRFACQKLQERQASYQACLDAAPACALNAHDMAYLSEE